jgi:hypothetical protein
MKSPFLFRCSALGKLMTEPKTKAEGPLSVGAKTAIREIAAQAIFGVDFEVGSKFLEKGNLVESEAINLINGVRGLMLSKNTERRKNDWITGECDLFDAERNCGHDAKSAWSLQTFPLCIEDVASAQRSLYEWQMRGYMMLWDCPAWEVNYCMVNTPEHLIGYEDQKLHIVDHIDPRHRLTTWVIERDADKEQAIRQKVEHARAYLAQFLADFDAARVAG